MSNYITNMGQFTGDCLSLNESNKMPLLADGQPAPNDGDIRHASHHEEDRPNAGGGENQEKYSP